MGMPSNASRHQGEVFLDARGVGRAMRLTWHHEAEVVVLSLWRDQVCSASFRLAAPDVAAFVDALVSGLHDVPSNGVSDAIAGQLQSGSGWASPPARPRHRRGIAACGGDAEATVVLPRQRLTRSPTASVPATGEDDTTVALGSPAFIDWVFDSGAPTANAG